MVRLVLSFNFLSAFLSFLVRLSLVLVVVLMILTDSCLACSAFSNEFVENGGRYYGLCSGEFITTSGPVRPTEYINKPASHYSEKEYNKTDENWTPYHGISYKHTYD
jgi:hypothetical protein